MELHLNIDYRQILGLIHQLPDSDVEKLADTLQAELSSKKSSHRNNWQELILKAPTWSDSDLERYLEARNHINKSRLA